MAVSSARFVTGRYRVTWSTRVTRCWHSTISIHRRQRTCSSSRASISRRSTTWSQRTASWWARCTSSRSRLLASEATPKRDTAQSSTVTPQQGRPCSISTCTCSAAAIWTGRPARYQELISWAPVLGHYSYQNESTQQEACSEPRDVSSAQSSVIRVYIS